MSDLLAFVTEGEDTGAFFTVDISPFLKDKDGNPEAPGTTTITYQEPTTAQMFQASEDAGKLKRRFHDFTEGLGATCALLALGHVSPQIAIPKGYFYGEMALKRGRLFMYLVSRFTEAFPHLKDPEEAIAQAKNDLSTVPTD